MAVTVRNTVIAITIDAVVVPTVLQASMTFGMDIAVAEAQFTVGGWDALGSATYWSTVSMKLYATSGGPATEFIGLLTEFDPDYYPNHVTVICKGYLILAQLPKLQQTTLHPTTTTGGLDMTNAGAGAYDNDIIFAAGGVLDLCGVLAAAVGVHDSLGAHVLCGTIAPQSFEWSQGQTGLDYIQSLDQISVDGSPLLGYRTFDEEGGYVKRFGIRMEPAVSPDLTFTEGVDIFSGTAPHSILALRNRVLVTGNDPGDGSGAVNYAIGTGSPQLVESISNPMIERQLDADLGGGALHGFACENVATYYLDQFNQPQTQTTFTTWRDDVVLLADTVLVASTARLGVDQNFWVQRVTRAIDGTGKFRQTIVGVTAL